MTFRPTLCNRTTLSKITLAIFLAALTGCEEKGAVTTNLDSTGGGSGAAKNVRIDWAASHARDVGLGGGGYKVYVRLGSAPTAANTTPVVIVNPGGGVHTTTTTLPLVSGRYFVSVSSYSPNAESPLSTATVVVVP